MTPPNPIPKTVFVYGDFFVLHPGHVRFLKFAANCGEKLYIGINNTQPTLNHPSPTERLETLQSLDIKAEVFLIKDGPQQSIDKIKPNILVKGKEHEKNINPELDWLKPWGGKIIFASGDSSDITSDFFIPNTADLHTHWIKPRDYISRHECSADKLKTILGKFQSLEVVVIGDLIIDEYINCDALGMSREDPTLVVSPKGSKKFLGGAGIVASHARALGAKLHFASVTGDDEAAKYANELLTKYDVKHYIFPDISRPTTLKQRYRVGDKTMLRVSHLSQHEISQDLSSDLYNKLASIIPSAQVLLFADFNYGCLPQSLVANLIAQAKTHGLVIGADSQSSSQIGDISRFNGVDLITPTEHEARLALRDNNSGLAHIGNQLIQKTSAATAFLTLGPAGVLVVSNQVDEKSGLAADLLPALNPIPIDTSGAGDSLLTISSMALACGATPYQAAYLGSLGAAIQVSRMGNTPITANELKGVLE